MDHYIDVPNEAKYGRKVPFTGIGQVCWDMDAKETVRISNGHCVKPHATPEEYKASHPPEDPGCLYAPSEAIALRVVGVTKTGDPIVGFTYRKVSPESLSVLLVQDEGFDYPQNLVQKIRPSRYVGRV